MSNIEDLGIDNPEDRTVLYTYDEVDILQERSYVQGQTVGRESMQKEIFRLIVAEMSARMTINPDGTLTLSPHDYSRIVGAITVALSEKPS